MEQHNQTLYAVYGALVHDLGKILYRAGEYLRFQPITQKQYDAIEAQIAAGGYECDVIVEEV